MPGDGWVPGPGYRADAVPLIAQGDFAVDDGGRAVHGWMDAMSGPTAIIAINDSVALGALEALTARGLRVPDDVALAGFDGVQLAASRVIDLTTVDQHIDQMGRLAVRILLRQLADSGSDIPSHEVLPTELLLRGSTEGASTVWPSGATVAR